MAVDYKQKFLDLKAKFMSSVDTSYRMGYEQGQKDAQLQNLQQQQQMMAMQRQAQMQSQQQGSPEMTPEEQADQFMQSQQQEEMDNGVSELESGIEELRDLLGKNEVDKETASHQLEALNKSLTKILEIREQQQLKKNMDSIKKIGSAVKKVGSMSLSFTKNAADHQKKALSMQKTIIDDKIS